MRSLAVLLLLLFNLAVLPSGITGERLYEEDEKKGREEEEEKHGGGLFILRNQKQVVKTEAGEVRVLKGYMGRDTYAPMHIGFISMEPNTLLVPQYVDSSLILFVRRGEMKIGWIYKDKLVEKKLKIGDVYRIPAGSAFYMVNTAKGQRLQIVCSIDKSESINHHSFESFFIAGGTNPTSVLAGFDMKTLTTAFNVTEDELKKIMQRQDGGPIVYMKGADRPSFMKLRRSMRIEEELFQEDEEEEKTPRQSRTWSWRKLLNSILGNEKKRGKAVESPDSCNLYDRKPDFKNDYGWSVALDEHDYSPLKSSGIGVYLVNLTGGAMMAPHINPTATEYGIILSGTGTIQVVFPNGTSAMNAEVREGDAFWVPRYFPFCQIASRNGPMEFFGFTTSAHRNRPQFLVGASSILQAMKGPEMAAAFDVSEERFKRFVESQKYSIILPTSPLSPQEEKKEQQTTPIKSIGGHMVMGFD